MPFDMLIHELVAKPKENPKEKMLSGCEIFFPDTLFFRNQQAAYIIQNDKDFCLTRSYDDDKKQPPNLNDLIAKLKKATETRKHQKGQFWLQNAK